MSKQGKFLTTSVSEPNAAMKDTLPAHGDMGLPAQTTRKSAAKTSTVRVRKTILKRLVKL